MKRLINRIRLFATFRYTDPSLHPGRWAGPTLEGTVAQPVAIWRRQGPLGGSLNPVFNQHNGPCTPAVCRIGPHTAHEDTCMCGKKRYGVFGAWS